jgi:hypothetical protein
VKRFDELGYKVVIFPVTTFRVMMKAVETSLAELSKKGTQRGFLDKMMERKEFYSQVWCVFDRDSFPLKNYVVAFELAQANTIKLAWTNGAFELWYLLHFDYIDSAISRKDYAKKLSQRGLKYKKADHRFYEKIKDKQDAAIKNAKKLERYWNEASRKFPERENPSTNVHKLVEFLNELADLGSVE